jgi:predicted Zn-dependent peptidase
MFLPSESFLKEKIDFVEYDLDNGLHVILHQDNLNPLVSADIWYHVGSKDEDSGRTGFAHLFEHMMFQGSKNVGKAEHFKYIQKAGGILNGSTNQDRTNYFETVPSNQLELVLWLESDRMSTLNVTQENFDNQREVVKEEKRQHYDNVPYGSRFNNIFSRAYNNHPYHWIPIGSMQDLDDANVNYAQGFYKKYYAPDNAVLVISGDINFEQTKLLVNKYFGDLKPSHFKRHIYPPNAFHTGEEKDTIYDRVQLPAIYMAYKIPEVTSKDIYPLELLSLILSNGKSSRLYNKMVYEQKISKSVQTWIWDLELGGLFMVSSTGMKNSSLDSMNKLMDDELLNIKEHEVSINELEKAKNILVTQYVNRIQTTLGVSDFLAYYWTYFKDTGKINSEVDDYLKVTEKDIVDCTNKYLTEDNRVVLYYLPMNDVENK